MLNVWKQGHHTTMLNFELDLLSTVMEEKYFQFLSQTNLKPRNGNSYLGGLLQDNKCILWSFIAQNTLQDNVLLLNFFHFLFQFSE